LNPGGRQRLKIGGEERSAPAFTLTLTTVIEYVSRMTCEWHWWHSRWASTKHGDTLVRELENVDCWLCVRQQTATMYCQSGSVMWCDVDWVDDRILCGESERAPCGDGKNQLKM